MLKHSSTGITEQQIASKKFYRQHWSPQLALLLCCTIHLMHCVSGVALSALRFKIPVFAGAKTVNINSFSCTQSFVLMFTFWWITFVARHHCGAAAASVGFFCTAFFLSFFIRYLNINRDFEMWHALFTHREFTRTQMVGSSTGCILPQNCLQSTTSNNDTSCVRNDDAVRQSRVLLCQHFCLFLSAATCRIFFIRAEAHGLYVNIYAVNIDDESGDE